MRQKLLAYIILFVHCPLLLFAGNEIQYSSDYVDPATGTTLAEIWKQAAITNSRRMIKRVSINMDVWSTPAFLTEREVPET